MGKVLAAQTSGLELGSLIPLEMTGMSCVNSHPEMGRKGSGESLRFLRQQAPNWVRESLTSVLENSNYNQGLESKVKQT